MLKLQAQGGRGRREGSPRGSGPCAWMGPFSTSIWGSPHEPLGLGSPRAGIRGHSPVGWEGGGSTHNRSDNALTPGGLRSETGQSSPAQSCDLFPILLDSVSLGTKGLTLPVCPVVQRVRGSPQE